jgi:hypothetical protein
MERSVIVWKGIREEGLCKSRREVGDVDCKIEELAVQISADVKEFKPRSVPIVGSLISLTNGCYY